MDFEYVHGVWKVCNIPKGLILYTTHIMSRLSVFIVIAMIQLSRHPIGKLSSVILVVKFSKYYNVEENNNERLYQNRGRNPRGSGRTFVKGHIKGASSLDRCILMHSLKHALQLDDTEWKLYVIGEHEGLFDMAS